MTVKRWISCTDKEVELFTLGLVALGINCSREERKVVSTLLAEAMLVCKKRNIDFED